MSRNNIKIMPGATVCEKSKLSGDITVGSHAIIHPSATVIAEAGPIIIGEHCLLEEQSKIIYRSPLDKEKGKSKPLVIGPYNVFEVDCCVESHKIGSNNVFESKSYVGNKVTVTNGCTIGAGCRLSEEMTLNENVIVFGDKCLMREGLDKPMNQLAQMETLRKMLYSIL